MREDVRREYWEDAGNKNPDLTKRSPNLGTVLCFPDRWNIYEMNETSFSKGTCSDFRLSGQEWTKFQVSLVNGQELDRSR